MKAIATIWALTACLVIAALSSCTKDDEPVNNPFTGTWTGTRTVSIPEEGIYYTKPDTAIIINGPETGQLGIRNMGLDYYAPADVAGSCYHYHEFSTGGTSDAGITSHVKFYGGGCIDGDSITESGYLFLTMNGYTVSGTWSTKLGRK